MASIDYDGIKNNKYTYGSKCYTNCPNRTYNNNYICQDCHPDCKECEKGPEENTTNCKSCLSLDKYLQFGKCVSNCSDDRLLMLLPIDSNTEGTISFMISFCLK